MNLYKFVLINKNGTSTSSIIPCDDWLNAYRIKAEIMKSKNIREVKFYPTLEKAKWTKIKN